MALEIDELFSYLREARKRIEKEVEWKIQRDMDIHLEIGKLLAIDQIETFCLHSHSESDILV
jgi:hypothetical protein